ncbi:hypothetical protein [Sulfurimonas sp.]
MAESHVMSALIKKRSELSGEIEHYEKLLKECRENLASIDKTIHIFDENYDLRTIKSKRVVRNSYFSSGEATKMVLDVLRTTDKPLKTDEISDIIASKKSLILEGKDKVNFQKSILYALNTNEKRGLVATIGKDGLSIIWQIQVVA